MKNRIIRTYSELITFNTFAERLTYLRLRGVVGEDTFGFDRILNQVFYRSREWKDIRNKIIMRDNGSDLGMPGYDIYDKILIHHMNPIDKEDILDRTSYLLNPEYLICTTKRTHDAIHYGIDLPQNDFVDRRPNDTCPWKR